MVTTGPREVAGLPELLARRAIQVAHDPTITMDEGASHLLHLAHGHDDALLGALDALQGGLGAREGDVAGALSGAVRDHACLLLRQALTDHDL